MMRRCLPASAGLLLLAVVLTACGASATAKQDALEMAVPEEEATVEQAESEVEVEPTGEPSPIPTEAPTPEPTAEPTPEPLPPEPIEVIIPTEDGLELAGTYFPAAVNPAPIVVLMHWAPGTQEDFFKTGNSWPLLALILQNRQDELAGAGYHARLVGTDRGDISYGVLTFDFRSFGKSPAGNARESGYLDAQAAVAYAKTLAGANPDSIMTFGASIGADGGVDGCVPNGVRDPACKAAIAASPGDYIGVPFADAVGMAGDLPIACFAAEGDGESADACKAGEAVGAANYQSFIFSGGWHGMQMFGLPDDPDLLTFVLDFFDAAG
jgi:pimeloyl-ACP methyl ester carboxylesterase